VAKNFFTTLHYNLIEFCVMLASCSNLNPLSDICSIFKMKKNTDTLFNWTTTSLSCFVLLVMSVAATKNKYLKKNCNNLAYCCFVTYIFKMLYNIWP